MKHQHILPAAIGGLLVLGLASGNANAGNKNPKMEECFGIAKSVYLRKAANTQGQPQAETAVTVTVRAELSACEGSVIVQSSAIIVWRRKIPRFEDY